MKLVKSNYLAQNGQMIQFFQTDRGPSTKAHVIWFSAFTHGPLLGKILKTEQRFHGFKAANSFTDFDFTLVRDDSGLTSDGTYYYGKADNPFIEESMSEFLQQLISTIKSSDPKKVIIGIGSSMGAYGATKFGILNKFDAVVALVPHFDLNYAKSHCGRKLWIDWACENGSDLEIDQYLNRLQYIIEKGNSSLPKMFVQSAVDDIGVHSQQVLPFVSLYRSSGGDLLEDFRVSGGHSMVNASNEYINAVLLMMADSKEYQPGMYETFPKREKSKPEILEEYFARLENAAAKLLRKFKIIS